MISKRVSLALSADLHLGTPFRFLSPDKAQRLRRLQLSALRTLCQQLARRNTNYLLLAGDLFDCAEPETALLDAFSQSFRLCPSTRVVMVAGNHDPLLPDGFWQRTAWPDNCYFFDENTSCLEFPDDRLRVYGSPFLSHSADEPLIDQLEPPLDDAWLNLLLQHGELCPAGMNSIYNPIPLAWLRASGLDLAALGHIHRGNAPRREESGIYWLYPGCLMGRGFDEEGPKGYYAGEFEKIWPPSASRPVRKLELRFQNINSAVFQNIRLPLDSFNGDSQEELSDWLSRELRRRLHSYEDGSLLLLRLFLCGGREIKPDLDYLARRLDGRYFHLELVDLSREKTESQSFLREKSLRGHALRLAEELRRSKDAFAWEQSWPGFADCSAEEREIVLDGALRFLLNPEEEDFHAYP